MTLLRHFVLFLFFLVVIPWDAAWAHVESDVPDAIAEIEYLILLEFKPDDVDTMLKLGMVLLRKDELVEAAEKFFRVLELDPVNYDAMDSLGLVRFREGKLEEAISNFKQATAANDSDTMAHLHLGQALEQKGDFVAAEKAYIAAIERAARNPANVAADRMRELREFLNLLHEKMKKKGSASVGGKTL